jgi:transposase-like protein
MFCFNYMSHLAELDSFSNLDTINIRLLRSFLLGGTHAEKFGLFLQTIERPHNQFNIRQIRQEGIRRM